MTLAFPRPAPAAAWPKAGPPAAASSCSPDSKHTRITALLCFHAHTSSRPKRTKFDALCFHIHTNSFSRNPLVLILMQTAGGVCPATPKRNCKFSSAPISFAHAQNATPLLSRHYTLLRRSFTPERKSTPLLSSACAQFRRNGGYCKFSVRILTVNNRDNRHNDNMDAPAGSWAAAKP